MLLKKKEKEKPSGVKSGEKKKSDSCHIPSDKEVRYAWSEVKLQEPSGFESAVQKTELRGSNRKAYSFIYNPYIPTIVGGKMQINVWKEDKHQ